MLQAGFPFTYTTPADAPRGIMEITFNSDQAAKTAKKLVSGFGAVLSEVASEAPKVFKRDEKTRPNLEQLVLSVIELEPASVTKIRKLVAEMSGGQKPNPEEFNSSIDSVVQSGLANEIEAKGRKLLAITDQGKKALAESREASSKTHSDAESRQNNSSWSLDWAFPANQLEVLRSAKRLSSAVMDVAANGTDKQQLLAAAELEKVRKRIHAILAGTKLD